MLICHTRAAPPLHLHCRATGIHLMCHSGCCRCILFLPRETLLWYVDCVRYRQFLPYTTSRRKDSKKWVSVQAPKMSAFHKAFHAVLKHFFGGILGDDVARNLAFNGVAYLGCHTIEFDDAAGAQGVHAGGGNSGQHRSQLQDGGLLFNFFNHFGSALEHVDGGCTTLRVFAVVLRYDLASVAFGLRGAARFAAINRYVIIAAASDAIYKAAIARLGAVAFLKCVFIAER